MRYYWAYKYNKPLSRHSYCIFKHDKDKYSVKCSVLKKVDSSDC